MKIIILGANGQLGLELTNILKNKYNLKAYRKEELDITDFQLVNKIIFDEKPKILINTAAYTSVEDAEKNIDYAYKVNSEAVHNISKSLEINNGFLIHYSTDYVYNSLNKKPINEDELIDPQNYYGYSKREGEKHIENSKVESIVIRTSWLYSKYGNNFVNAIIDKSKTGENLKVINDQFGCPTYAKDLALAVIQILESDKRIDEKTKIFNYSNGGSTNWFNFAKKILFLYGSDKIIEPVDSEYFKDQVKRPKFSITSKQKIIDTFNLEINNWDKSLADFISNDLK